MVNTKVNTKKAARRELSFHCTGCLKEELARIEAAHHAGKLSHTGNWSEGEIFDHLAIGMEFSIDGFPPDMKVPFVMRIMARMFKGMVTSGKTLSPGFSPPKGSEAFLPRTGVSFDQGLARLRKVIDRLDSGAKCTGVSPAFGALSHDEWMRLHLGHAQLHIGFIAY